MADFFKGLAGGFGTGLQLGQAVRERNMRDELAQAYAKPETYTDYTPEQMQQIQGLQASGAYDVTAVPGAEGQAPTLRYAPRPGLDTGEYPMQAGAGIEIAPRQVQRYGAQTTGGQFDPTALRGLQMQEAARVLGSYGDVRGAAALQAQAEEQAYQAKRRPLELAGLERQAKLGDIQLTEAERNAAASKRQDEFSAFAAERPEATVAELKDAAFKQFKLTPDQWQKTVTTRLGIENAEMDSFKNSIKKKLQGKNLTQLGSLYNSDPDFDDKTDLAIVPGKGGAVTLNFIDKGSKTITGSQTFKNEALATEYLNKQATEPETIGTWMLNLRKTESGIEAQGAATEASRSTVGLRNAQIKQIQGGGKNAEERADIVERFQALTEEEQAGPKGQGLLKQFNLLNAKAGAMVPLGTTPKAAGPVKMDDVDKENLRYYRDWLKDPKNSKLPQGQKDAFAAELGVTEFIKRGGAGPTAGFGTDVYAAPQQGLETGRATPAPAARASAAPATPALTAENTKLLTPAGNTGYNVQLPDGTTRVMTVPELTRMGYKFPSGTGLQPAWYEGLMPRR